MSRPGRRAMCRALTVTLLAVVLDAGGLHAAGKKYVNREYGFAAEFPETWVSQAQKTATGTALVFSGPQGTDEYYTTINLQVVLRLPVDSLAERADRLERQWATAPAYRQLARAPITLAGQPAIRLLVQYQQPGGKEMFQQEQVIAERGGYFYMIGYTAPQDLYDKAHDVMKAALETFEFLPFPATILGTRQPGGFRHAPVAQLDRAPVFQAGDPAFGSRPLDLRRQYVSSETTGKSP